MDASNVTVFVSFEYGLKLLLELFETSHLMRFTLVPTSLQLLHLLDNLGDSALLEELFVVTVHLFLEFRLLLFVPRLLIFSLIQLVQGEAVIFDIALILSQFLKLCRHLNIKAFVGIIKLPLHPHIFVLEEILEVLCLLLPILGLELSSTPFLIDLVVVHLHFLIENEIARPSFFFLLGSIEDGMQVGFDILPEKLAELDEHLLGAITIIQGVEFKPPLSSFHHPIYVFNLGPYIVILYALAQSHVLPSFPATPPYVGQEVLRVDVLAEGTHGENGMNTWLALPHQTQVHLQGLGNCHCLPEGKHFL